MTSLLDLIQIYNDLSEDSAYKWNDKFRNNIHEFTGHYFDSKEEAFEYVSNKKLPLYEQLVIKISIDIHSDDQHFDRTYITLKKDDRSINTLGALLKSLDGLEISEWESGFNDPIISVHIQRMAVKKNGHVLKVYADGELIEMND